MRSQSVFLMSAMSQFKLLVTLCAPSKSEVSVSPVLWNSCDQTLALRDKCSGGSSSWCLTPRLRGRGEAVLMWGSELTLLWENLCDIIILQVVGHPPSEYGI